MKTLVDAQEAIRLAVKIDALDAQLKLLANNETEAPRVFIDIGGAHFEIDEGFTAAAIPACLAFVDAERMRTVDALETLNMTMTVSADGKKRLAKDG